MSSNQFLLLFNISVKVASANKAEEGQEGQKSLLVNIVVELCLIVNLMCTVTPVL